MPAGTLCVSIVLYIPALVGQQKYRAVSILVALQQRSLALGTGDGNLMAVAAVNRASNTFNGRVDVLTVSGHRYCDTNNARRAVQYRTPM